MQCPSCHQEVAQSRFCGNCGAPMAVVGATHASPLPVAFNDGRYRVERKLGEGGKGIVFLCQDTLLGRRVAVKLIKGENMDEDALARFQREVQAMAALVHPNVVTIFDIGKQDGKDYLVLELMEGGDVEGLIKKAPNKRLDAATAVRITSEAARGLAHAHTHGILHRDIKPGNIWLTKEGFAKLGDFGLAYLSQGAKLTRAGMMVGTVAYMAPELALGRQADARSDLYMLGASLYEMVTGRLPFPGDDPVRMIFSHINDLTPAPRRFAPDIPESLERLVMRLLAKDPEQRPGTANEVIGALAAISGMPSDTRRGDPDANRDSPTSPGVRTGMGGETPPLQQTPPSLLGKGAGGLGSSSPAPTYARPLVGRDRERDALRARLDAAMQGQGGLVFLTGEAGIGKTRLAEELRSYARQRGCLWLEGRYEKDAGIPGQPYVEAIRQYLRTASRGAIAQHVGQYAAELSRSYPDIAAALGRSPAAAAASMIQEDPQGARQRQLDAFCHLFSSFASEKPLVLFLDDLQWSPSMDYLQALALRAQTEPMLLVGTYREQELKGSQALSRTVLAMNRLRLFQAMPLHRLERPQVAEMVRGALGQSPSEALVDLVNQRTQGNPFFVEELVRHLVETGALTQSDKVWDVKDTPGLQMPDSVKVLVEEKLERLSEATRTMLAMASVIGGEFDLPLLQEVTGLDDEALANAMEEALDARILVPKSGVGRETYAFADNQIREALYEGISAFRRRRFHLRVGQAIEKVHARRLEEHYGALANHFIQGNDTEKAVDYSIKAGDAAYARATFPRAMEHYRVASELLDELGEESERAAHVNAQLGMNLVISYTVQTNPTERTLAEAAHMEKATTLLVKHGLKRRAASLHRIMAGVRSQGTGVKPDVTAALGHYQAAADLLKDEPASLERVLAYGGLSFSRVNSLRLEEAQALATQALHSAESIRDEAALCEGHVRVSLVLAHKGNIKEAISHAESAWEHAGRAQPNWFVAQAIAHVVVIYPWPADVTHQLKWVGRLQEIVRKAGTVRYASFVNNTIAECLAYSGHGEEARALALAIPSTGLGTVDASRTWRLLLILGEWESAEQILVRAIQQQRYPRVALNLQRGFGELLIYQQEPRLALPYLTQSRMAAYDAGYVTEELDMLAPLTIAYARLGQLDEAGKALARAQEILASGEEWLGLPAYVYHAEGVLSAAQGRYPQAEAAFHRAADTSMAHGMVYDQGQALYDWAVMYLDRAASSDTRRGEVISPASPAPTTVSPADALALRNRGQDLLDQALDIFRRCDAKKDIEKCLARKERLTA